MTKRKMELTEEERQEREIERKRKNREYMRKVRAEQKAARGAQSTASNVSIAVDVTDESEVENSVVGSGSVKSINTTQLMTPGISRVMETMNFEADESKITIEQVLGPKFESHCPIDEMCSVAQSGCQLEESQLPDMENEQEHIDQQSLVFGLLKLIAESDLKIGLLSPFFWNDYCRRAEDDPAKYLMVKPPIDHDEHVFLLIPILFGRHFTVVIMEKQTNSSEWKEHFIDSLHGSMNNEVKKLIDKTFVRLFAPWTGLNSNAKKVENQIRQGDQQTDSWNCAAYVVANVQNFFVNINEHDHGVYLKKTGMSGASKRLELYGMLAQMFELFAEDSQDMEVEESLLSKREKRLQHVRQSVSKKRTTEDKTERADRLTKKRQDIEKFRSAETKQEKAERLAEQRARQQNARVTETDEEKLSRLTKDREKRQSSRVGETDQEKAERLGTQAERQTNVRRQAKTRTLQLCAATDWKSSVRHELSKLNTECDCCSGLHFAEEKATGKRTFNDCCNHGKVRLDPVPYVDELKELLNGQHKLSREFMKDIRRYNASHAFAAFNARRDKKLIQTGGPYCFRIQGQIYYEVDLNVNLNQKAEQYGQVYFSDPAEATKTRLKVNTGTNQELMELLDQLMRKHNVHAQLYVRMSEKVEELKAQGKDVQDVQMIFKMRPGYDPKRFNEPTVDEIGAVFTTDASGQVGECSLVIQEYGEVNPRVVSSLSPLATAWLYPIFFPKGSLGWSPEMKKINSKTRTRVTRLEFYSSKLGIRNGEFNPIHYGGKLFQQFVVDAYVQVEGDRMKWIRNNQKTLKVMHYDELHASLSRIGKSIGKEVGRVFVLPSTHFGSPRFMRENYQDAMSIVLKHGKPDLFVTMTCNPNWPEIVETLKETTTGTVRQTASDRPDVVARVFRLKVEALIDDLTKKQVFGEVKCWIYVTEFQKRGLPHVHLLLSLKDGRKFMNPDEIDRYLSAELPDPEEDKELSQIVTKFMIHRKCGPENMSSPCMVKGKCKSKYPKQFSDQTKVNSKGYSSLKRRQTGRVIEMKGVKYDNRRVVPYSPWLLKRFNSHINVEVVSMIENVKYLYKYAYKGYDAACMEFSTTSGNMTHDEIKDHVDGRYIGPVEACYRLLELKMYDRSHSVERLPIHFENQQPVCVEEECTEEQLERAMNKDTKLMDYFKLNSRDQDACALSYVEVPTKYTWCRKEVVGQNQEKMIVYRWEKRKAHFNVTGRMYAISPSQGDLWYLRLLLQHVKGAKSFKDLRIVDGEEYPSFSEACLALGLVEDDREFIKCMEEAVKVLIPKRLRILFVNILLYCNPTAPEVMWEMFKEQLSEDFVYRLKQTDRSGTNHEQTGILKAYKRIDTLLRRENKSIADFPSMDSVQELDNYEEPIDHEHEMRIGQEMRESLNAEQEQILKKVLDVLDNGGPGRLFFVDGLGGTGKTFVYKVICHLVRGRTKKYLTCAFTGIAALLLPEGRTCHKTFGLPVPVNDESSSSLTSNSRSGRLLIETDIIVWDEAPMAPRYAMEIADRKLRELMRNDQPFGGKIVIMGGDFRQILPILKFGTVSEMINLSICSSRLWPEFEKFALVKNMRTKPEEVEFAEFLKQVGEGELNDGNSELVLPEKCVVTESLEEVIFGDMIRNQEFDQMGHSAILVSKHVGVNETNQKVLNMLVGTEKTYLSIDSAVEVDQTTDKTLLLPEYLNAIEEGSLPPHKLELKLNAVVILLRNLSQDEGLCNGTRLLVVGLNDHSIECKILTGVHVGELHTIPRINNTIEYQGMFHLNRKQFPLKLAFAMTINKSQGQTFEKVGLNLEYPVFEHGQLYVALSRVRSWDSIRVFIPIDTTVQLESRNPSGRSVKNIVHQEIFKKL